MGGDGSRRGWRMGGGNMITIRRIKATSHFIAADKGLLPQNEKPP